MIKCAHCKNKHHTIDDVKMCSKVTYAFSASKPVTVPVVAKPTPVTEPGMYRFEGNVYRVVFSKKSKKLYAALLVQEIKNKALHKLTFEYEAGAIFKIDAKDRMTVAEIAAIGQITGHCWVCATPLKVQKSIKAGIGPVCVKKV